MINSSYLGLDTAQAGTLAYDANYFTTGEAGSSTINSETYLNSTSTISGYNGENVGGLMFRDANGWTILPSSRTLKYLHTRVCSLGVGVTPSGTEGELLVNGNVGIGITSPGTQLHSIMTSNGNTIPDTGINESCHTALGVMGSTPYGLAIGTFESSGDSWIQAKRFTDSDKFKLLLNPDGGNVGIGTNDPERKLTIETGTNFDGLIFNNSTSKLLAKLARGDSDTTTYFALYDGSDTDSGGTSTNTVTISNNGNSFFNSGNVGIGTTSPSELLELNGWIGRTIHHNGALCGGYNNVANNGTKTNPIYVIGSNYKPNEDTLNNMYGIGYTHTNSSFIKPDDAPASWGLYVAADGDARIWLGASGVGNSYFNTTGGLGIGNNDPGDFKLKVTGTAFVSSTFQANGNVGIGDSPSGSYKLKTYGSSWFYGGIDDDDYDFDAAVFGTDPTNGRGLVIRTNVNTVPIGDDNGNASIYSSWNETDGYGSIIYKQDHKQTLHWYLKHVQMEQ